MKAASMSSDEGAKDFSRLSDHLLVYHGPINVGIVRDGDRGLLIDCGDGGVLAILASVGIVAVDKVLFTHHHRDQACGAYLLAAEGAKIGVPAAERDHFEKVDAYWNDPKHRWHLYNQHPHHLMLAEPVRVDAVHGDGDVFKWGPARIRVLATPGHTNGSVSYLVEVDGQKVVFCGDAIYDQGQVWDLHSLQKGFKRGDVEITDYHGYLGARPELVESLNRIKGLQPQVLVPAHGRVMTDPSKAIDLLLQRLDACYENYVAISALRHYFPPLFAEYAGRPNQMPIRKGKPVPSFLRHIGTSWVMVADDGAALVMDCGGGEVVGKLREMMAKGEIRAVEGLWVTHYHDDHTDGIPEFQRMFDCPCLTDESVAQVITDPLAWRLPCISPSRARVDRIAKDGESWPWHEFKLTAYHLPGQTLYHAGLLVEGHQVRALFVGDSFTMAGIDDYCMHNRNWLGPGVGFDRCIGLIERLRPTHIFNCHVDEAFDFTPEECRFMKATLAERERLCGQLVPWDHANYGTDEPWVRCQPYEQKVVAGSEVGVRVVFTNHSAQARVAAARAVLPRAWGAPESVASTARSGAAIRGTEWKHAEVPAKSPGEVSLRVKVPDQVRPGRYVMPVDVRFGSWGLPQFTEAIVVV